MAPNWLECLGNAREDSARAISGVATAQRVDTGVGVAHREIEAESRGDKANLPVPVILTKQSKTLEPIDSDITNRPVAFERNTLGEF